jgi:hypothetical protein
VVHAPTKFTELRKIREGSGTGSYMLMQSDQGIASGTVTGPGASRFTLLGAPVFVTTQLPGTQVGGKIILADMNQVAVGRDTAPSLGVFTEPSPTPTSWRVWPAASSGGRPACAATGGLPQRLQPVGSDRQQRRKRPRGVPSRGRSSRAALLDRAPMGRQALRNHLFEQDCPADQGVATLADTGLDGQVEITGFVDQAADLAGRLGDVDQQHMPTTGNVLLGHEGSLLVSLGPARFHRVRPRQLRAG